MQVLEPPSIPGAVPEETWGDPLESLGKWKLYHELPELSMVRLIDGKYSIVPRQFSGWTKKDRDSREVGDSRFDQRSQEFQTELQDLAHG